jgi:poly(3-hydroxybutyrate) depolymerase
MTFHRVWGCHSFILLIAVLVMLAGVSAWALPPVCQGLPPTNDLSTQGCYYAGNINFAGTGSLFSRAYSLYLPRHFSASWTNIPLIVALHPTSSAGPENPPSTVFLGNEFTAEADKYGFILLEPASTWNPNNGGQWFWNSLFLNSLFTNGIPDDSGYLTCLIQAVYSTSTPCGASSGATNGGPYGFSIDPTRIAVTGVSSGGFMAQRMGIEHSDLLSAIAPVSAMVYAGKGNLGIPLHAISYLEEHWDGDRVINYCGGSTRVWGAYEVLPTVGSTLSPVEGNGPYWINSDKCSGSTYEQLCTKVAGTPTASSGYDIICPNGAEVQFVRNSGVGHEYTPAVIDQIVEFLLAHRKPG